MSFSDTEQRTSLAVLEGHSSMLMEEFKYFEMQQQDYLWGNKCGG